MYFILLTSFAYAGWYTNDTWSTTADEGTYEAFAHACDDWSGTSNGNLAATISGATLWLGYVGQAGYTHYKFGTDANAWSSSWEQANSDDSYVDAGDFAYLATHGSSATAYFNGSSGDDKLTASETQWGNNDDEAIAFDTCQVLDATGRSAFASYNKNDGIHYLFGFSSNALDITTTASYYGMYMKDGTKLSSAWKSATQKGHTSAYTGASVRFYTGSCDTSTDTAYATSCDPKKSSSTSSSTWAL